MATLLECVNLKIFNKVNPNLILFKNCCFKADKLEIKVIFSENNTLSQIIQMTPHFTGWNIIYTILQLLLLLLYCIANLWNLRWVDGRKGGMGWDGSSTQLLLHLDKFWHVPQMKLPILKTLKNFNFFQKTHILQKYFVYLKSLLLVGICAMRSYHTQSP